MSDVEFNIKGLEQLMKALKNPPVARVGILGSTNARGAGGVNWTHEGGKNKADSNATIGAYHEFGTRNLPIRSFLRMPITTYLNKRLQASGAFSRDVMRGVITQGTIMPWLKIVTLVAEGLVLEAFDTGGFGTWKPSNYRYKNNGETLIETQQLMRSITSEVRGTA